LNRKSPRTQSWLDGGHLGREFVPYRHVVVLV